MFKISDGMRRQMKFTLCVIAALAILPQCSEQRPAAPAAQSASTTAAPTTSPASSAPAPVPFAPASTPDQEKLRILGAKRYPGTVHVLPATPETTQWGWFNNAQPPVLHVDSGDTIVFETMMHSHNQVVPGTNIEQINHGTFRFRYFGCPIYKATFRAISQRSYLGRHRCNGEQTAD